MKRSRHFLKKILLLVINHKQQILNWKIQVFLLILWLFAIEVHGQSQFDCNGRIYRVIEQQGGTSFQELTVEESTGKLDVLDLQFFDNVKINGIAYHPTQNLIYGILLGKQYQLCRIDGKHRMEVLRTLPLPEDMLFVSGDVSPDERYLVLLGFSPDEATNLVALVDLTASDFPTQLIQVSTTADDREPVYCADIAFHPTTDRLFGFDHLSGRLITIDLINQKIDNTSYPTTEVLRGNVPSIFFDAYGELFGIGSPNAGYATNRNFYHFNVDNGTVTFLDELNFESNQDACSCPFKVKLLNRVSSRTAAPCTELTFEFTLINRTDRVQTKVQLTDSLPPYLEIKSVDPLPFTANIISGPGTSLLDIRDITLPIGSASFSMTVLIKRNAPKTTIYNSAYLDGVIFDSRMETTRVRSDDPETPKPNDPTYFTIDNLSVTFSQGEVFLCPENSIELQPNLLTNATYEWNTGERSPKLRVNSPGAYQVTITTACEEAVGRISVTPSWVEVELGPDRTVERGQTIDISPNIQSSSTVQSLFWTSPSGADLLCNTCTDQRSTPVSNATYQLQAINADGCTGTDLLRVQLRDFGVFAPNAFSPNGDQINDCFFLQSRQDYKLKSLRVFDRWGSLVFQSPEGSTNQSEIGWNGKSRGKMMRSGVYIWTAEIVSLAGTPQLVSGEVSLIR